MVKKYRTFQRPSLSQDMLTYMLVGGILALGAVNPAFLTVGVLLKAFQKEEFKNKKRFRQTFYELRRRGLVHVESKKGKIFLSLTEEGKKRAELFALSRSLEGLCKERISKRRKKKQCLVLFDVPSEHRLKRDALRHLLKRLGCVQLQKSVWFSEVDCREEVAFLKKFFEFSAKECRVVTVEDIGGPIS